MFNRSLSLSFFINFVFKFLRKWKLSLDICLRRMMRLCCRQWLFIAVDLKRKCWFGFMDEVYCYMDRMRNLIIIVFCIAVIFIWDEVCVLNKILLFSSLSWKYNSSSYFWRIQHSFYICTPILIVRLLWVNRVSVWTFIKRFQTTFSRKRHY